MVIKNNNGNKNSILLIGLCYSLAKLEVPENRHLLLLVFLYLVPRMQLGIEYVLKKL